MKYMAFNQSEILREYNRIITEKDEMVKAAQAVIMPLNEEEKGKLQQFLLSLKTAPSNGPGMEKWINRLKGQNDPYLKEVHDALFKRHELWAAGKSAKEIASVELPNPAQDSMANKAPVHTSMMISMREKTADQKAYDVMPKEDMVDKAHPNTTTIEGEVVENLHEQQEADMEVAEKSAKSILINLYKLAKRLKVENKEQAYTLVKNTFLDLSKSYKQKHGLTSKVEE